MYTEYIPAPAKPLQDWTVQEKAQWLHELLPTAIPEFLTSMLKDLLILLAKERAKQYQINQIIINENWRRFAVELRDIIHNDEEQLLKDSAFFAHALFSGEKRLLTLHCLKTFIKEKKRSPFRRAVKLFFMPSP